MISVEMNFLWEQLDIMKINCDFESNTKLKEKENIKICNEKTYTCYCDFKDQDLNEIDGALLCTECGLVLEPRIISEEAEWGNYTNDDGSGNGANMNRCGEAADELTPSYSNYTEIRGSSKMSLLNKYLSIDYKDKVMYHLKVSVKETLKLNGLPENICQESLLLYKKITGSKDIFRGSNKISLIAACVYHVSKQRNLGISSAKITESFNIQNKSFSKFYKYLIESGVCSKAETNGNVLYKCSELVGRHCISLEMPYKAASISKKVAESIEELSLFPNISLGALVGGVIFFVSEEMNLGIKKKIIAELCGTSESGLSKIFSSIKENKILILNNAKKN